MSEELLNKTTVLDHGYLAEVEHWGSDENVIRAARMSTNKGFLGWGPNTCPECNGVKYSASRDCEECFGQGGRYDELAQDQWHPCHSCETLRCKKCDGRGQVPGDEKLLRYLYENWHNTPFEMAGLIIEVQAPIFVFREWHRHRTQSYNEMSARYTPLPDINYIPSVERLLLNSKTNKQAGTVAGAAELTEANAEWFRERLQQSYEEAEIFYQVALANGVPKELARIHLPVGRYSRMRASANLRNWLAFLTLRMDPKAQYEIRVYANEVAKILRRHFPRTMELFDGRK